MNSVRLGRPSVPDGTDRNEKQFADEHDIRVRPRRAGNNHVFRNVDFNYRRGIQPMTSEPVALFENVEKTYPGKGLRGARVQALRGVSFRVEPGEVLGLLGPNRAGKTTLVKIFLGLCGCSQGSVLRLGKPLSDRSTLARVGYMHENQSFPRYLKAIQLLDYYGILSLVGANDRARRAPELLERVGLADRKSDPISCFSKGMVQRLALAQALLNEPELLVLDEPTEGLDLLGRRLVHDAVIRQRDRGRSTILISHLLTDVERLCDRVAVVVQGRLAYLGPLTSLTHDVRSGQERTLEEALQPLYESTN